MKISLLINCVEANFHKQNKKDMNKAFNLLCEDSPVPKLEQIQKLIRNWFLYICLGYSRLCSEESVINVCLKTCKALV